MPRVKPRARADLDVVEIDGEAVVYDLRELQIHLLNHSAALVFGLCDGTTTIREMADGIADVYEMPADEVEKQIRSLLRQLREAGLLSGTALKDARSAEEVEEKTLDERERRRIAVPQDT